MRIRHLGRATFLLLVCQISLIGAVRVTFVNRTGGTLLLQDRIKASSTFQSQLICSHGHQITIDCVPGDTGLIKVAIGHGPRKRRQWELFSTVAVGDNKVITITKALAAPDIVAIDQGSVSSASVD